MNKIAASIALALIGSSGALSASAADATANGSVSIVTPVSVSSSQDLQFGAIIKPASGEASIAVSAAGVRSLGTATAASNAASNQAVFTISGDAGLAITVTVDSSFDMVNALDNTKKLTVTTSTDKAGAQALGGAGSLTVNVGGAFTLGAAATAGDYSGSFKVAANYQ